MLQLLQLSYEDGIEWLQNPNGTTQAKLQKAERKAQTRTQVERQEVPNYAKRCSVCGGRIECVHGEPRTASFSKKEISEIKVRRKQFLDSVLETSSDGAFIIAKTV